MKQILKKKQNSWSICIWWIFSKNLKDNQMNQMKSLIQRFWSFLSCKSPTVLHNNKAIGSQTGLNCNLVLTL